RRRRPCLPCHPGEGWTTDRAFDKEVLLNVQKPSKPVDEFFASEKSAATAGRSDLRVGPTAPATADGAGISLRSISLKIRGDDFENHCPLFLVLLRRGDLALPTRPQGAALASYHFSPLDDIFLWRHQRARSAESSSRLSAPQRLCFKC